MKKCVDFDVKIRQSVVQVSMAILIAIACIGCGGGGATPSTSAKIRAAEAVQEAFKGSSTVTDQTGRSASRMPKMQKPASREGGGIFEPGYVFQGQDGYWYKVISASYEDINGANTLTDYRLDCFTDEALANKAGYQEREYNVSPTEVFERVEILYTAGASAGSESVAEYTSDNEGNWKKVSARSKYRTEDGPASLFWEFDINGSQEGATFKYSFSYPEKTFSAEGVYRPDGSVRSVWTTSTGYGVEFISGQEDGGGSFTLTNPNDNLMPARGVFDNEGKGTITFADGSSDAFDLNDPAFYVNQ